MRVFIADDQKMVRSALRLLLEQDLEVSVVGEAVEADGLLSQVRGACADLVLLDWELPGLQTADPLLPTLRTLCPHMSVIALSGRPEARRASLAAGADAFVSKVEPPDRLLAAVNGCLDEGYYGAFGR